MTPTYTLIYGNSHEIELPYADAVVSDPPYGILHKRGLGLTKRLQVSLKTINGKKMTRRAQQVYGDAEVFNPERWLKYPKVAFTGAQHFYSTLPAGGMLHCWNKRRDGWKKLDQGDCDIIWVNTNRPVSRTFNQAWSGLIREGNNRYGKGLHPTEKPLALMQWIISLLTLPTGATVLDPYMGSGTTGVAALTLGYNFVGVETVKEHYCTADKRMRDLVQVLQRGR